MERQPQQNPLPIDDGALKNKFFATPGKPKRILSLDGGGVRGALTIGYLTHVEALLRKRFNNQNLVLADYYDLIGGTSTGAIIASCLALGMTVGAVENLYLQLGRSIFERRRYHFIPRSWTNFRALFKATYNESTLEGLLKSHLDVKLCDYSKLKCPLAIMTKRADTYSLWSVANHPAGIYSKSMSHLTLWELCRASSAAPYYFRPKKLLLKSRDKAQFDAAFIDGGVSLANSPALQLYLTATVPSFGFGWPAGEDNIFITSFGTGNGVSKDSVDKIVNRRAIEWASRIPELFMTDALEMNQIFLQLFGRNYGPVDIIDSQHGDLKNVTYPTEKIFSFIRCNVKLTSEYLQTQLGINKSNEQIKSLVEMDHFENIAELLSIGKTAGAKITDAYFPTLFNI